LVPFLNWGEDDQFYLAHANLDAHKILIDPTNGQVNGIIDWDSSATLPSEAHEHYPLLLQKECFENDFSDVFDDPFSELQQWRETYASEYDGDECMQKYFRNIDKTTLLEEILRYDRHEIVDCLVECRDFIEAMGEDVMPFPKFSGAFKRGASGYDRFDGQLESRTENKYSEV
jgi:hypothetical protein